MIKYKLHESWSGPKALLETFIIDLETGNIFPDQAIENTHYQAYLRWLEEGNTPLPAEENQ